MRHDRRSTPPGLVLGGVCYAIRFRCLRCLRVATRRGRVCGDRAVRGRLRCPGAAAGPGCVCGGRAVRGRLRCPGAAARPGWVVWCPFGMREAVVPEGGGRAWVGGVAPLRHAGGCGVRGRRRGVGVFVVTVQCAGGCSARGRRQGLAGLRADAPSRRLAARTASGRAAALGHREEGRCGYRSPARPFLTARSRW